MRERSPRGEGARLRHDLVAAASTLLMRGADTAPFSLRSVAKAAGVSPTAVYRHFASIEELIEAVIVAQNDSLRSALGEGSVLEWGHRYAQWGLANKGSYALLFESADRFAHRGGPGTPGWDIVEALAEKVSAERTLSIEEGTVLAIRHWAALHGVVSLRIHKPGLPWPSTVEQEVDAIVERL